MKKVMAIIIACAMCACLVVTVSANPKDADPTNAPIGASGHTHALFADGGGDTYSSPYTNKWSEVASFTVKFNITNWDEMVEAQDGDPVDVQVVLNSAAHGWGNIGDDLNQWGNIALANATDSMTHVLDGALDDDQYFQVCVGAWNGLEGTFSITLFNAAGAEIALVKAGAVTTTSDTITTTTTTTTTTAAADGDKINEDTGIVGVAALAGVAVVAAGAVMVSRRRK
ncbi:MAG: hypothetical protein FWD34_03410 [Oscillospiraceae bacterium]|nr:hypothetical protein [Oscillospiraceae bacterium]